MNCTIADFGARGDGLAASTAAIQVAIDRCHDSGGGVVRVPAGCFRIGTLELRSGVMLELASGAVLLASEDPADYRKAFPGQDSLVTGIFDSPFNRDQRLIFAKGAKRCGICGHGVIDANGGAFYRRDAFRISPNKWKPEGREYLLKEWRPGPAIGMLDSEGVVLEDFTLLDAPMFGVELLHCRNVRISGLEIASDFRFHNSDGINVKASQNVFITDCRIASEDDAVCFYSDRKPMPGLERSDNPDWSCSHIAVENCRLRSACSAVRIGYMGDDPIRDLRFGDLEVAAAQTVVDVLCCGGGSPCCVPGRRYAGPRIENVRFAGIRADDVKWGITVNAHSSLGPTGSVGGFRFERMAVRSAYGNYLSGTAAHPVTEMTFRECSFQVAGGPVSSPQPPPQLPLFKSMTFGFGWFFRHARDIRFEHCDLLTPADFTPVVAEHCGEIRGIMAEKCGASGGLD